MPYREVDNVVGIKAQENKSVNKEIKGGKRREVIKNKIVLRPAVKIAIRTGLETEFLLSWLQNKLG